MLSSGNQLRIASFIGRQPDEKGGVETVARNLDRQLPHEMDFFHGSTFRSPVELVKKYKAVKRNGYDVIHVHGDNAPFIHAVDFDAPVVATMHGTTKAMYHQTQDTLSFRNQVGCFLKSRPEHHALQAANIVVTVSKQVAQEVTSLYSYPGKLFVVENGVDIDKFYPDIDRIQAISTLNKNPGIELDPKTRYLGWVGGNPNGKGLHHAAQLVTALNDRSDERYRLLAAGVTADTSFICGLGSVPPQHMPYFYNAVDAVINTSRYEGFGLVQLEAPACGTPVVQSGHLPHICSGGTIAADHEISVDDVCDAMDLAPERCRQAAKQFSWTDQAQLYDKLFQELQ